MTTEWKLNQANRVTFVMVDATNTEVAGIGDGNLAVNISKAGGAFAGGAGTDTEIGNGWYTYLATAGEADAVGPVSLRVTGAGAVQQNLEYIVQQRNPGAIAFTYIVTNSVGGAPIEGVQVWITTDIAGSNVIWNGESDAAGVARDDNGVLPFLDAGVYQFWSQKSSFIFSNPDQETVS